MPLTFKEVAEILKLIDASQCDEVVLELDGARLVVRRNSSGAAGGSFTPAPGEEPVRLGAGETPGDASPQAKDTENRPKEEASSPAAEAGVSDVRAPMVGTFYRRPSPDEEPFVEEGTSVKKGDPLCLIEVMKLFTTIESPADGTIESIAAGDATLVEFNQLLFRLRA